MAAAPALSVQFCVMRLPLSQLQSAGASTPLALATARSRQSRFAMLLHSRKFPSTLVVQVSLALYLKAGMELEVYFKTSNEIWVGGLTAGLMSFILFWTAAYAIVYIY